MEEVDRVVAGLTVLRDRLYRRVSELNRRHKLLFEQVVAAKSEGDDERAVIYANELKQLRAMMNLTIRNELIVEAVINRLSTVRDLEDLRNYVAPIRSLVSSIAPDIRGILPEVSVHVQKVQSDLEDLSLEMGSVPNVIMRPLEPDEEEVRRILEEAGEVAKRRLRDSTPEPPSRVL
ncbi:MAG: hypothetical protein NZ988_06160 [Thaumarchaeota archaeon]|nr:hypothetical protein [Candidatus Calditenuaceae archaeon]MDW8187607.1 hypothetical protein [Nitrososphaerota archaeon]